jgi:hypothetical protein
MLSTTITTKGAVGAFTEESTGTGGVILDEGGVRVPPDRAEPS